jgi:bifunctional ADP-heptose synthase (sugar kinase/adenylyltransferase)
MNKNNLLKFLTLGVKMPKSEKAAALANLGGGLVCEELGVVPISKEKLTSEAIRLHLAY